jgi:hypothetical protein
VTTTATTHKSDKRVDRSPVSSAGLRTPPPPLPQQQQQQQQRSNSAHLRACDKEILNSFGGGPQ